MFCMNFNSDDVDSSSKSQMLRLNRKLISPSFCSKTITKALTLWRLFFFLGDVYVLISWKQTDAIVERVTFRTEVILTHLVTFQKYQVSAGLGRRRRMGLLVLLIFFSFFFSEKKSQWRRKRWNVRWNNCSPHLLFLKTLFTHYPKGKDLNNTQKMLRESRIVLKHLDGWVYVTPACGISWEIIPSKNKWVIRLDRVCSGKKRQCNG